MSIKVLWYSQREMDLNLRKALEPCEIVHIKRIHKHASEIKEQILLADIVCLDAPMQFKDEVLTIAPLKTVLCPFRDEFDPEHKFIWKKLICIKAEYVDWFRNYGARYMFTEEQIDTIMDCIQRNIDNIDLVQVELENAIG